MAFLSGKFSFREFQLHLAAVMYVVMAMIQLLNIILKTWISIDFEIFSPEKLSIV